MPESERAARLEARVEYLQEKIDLLETRVNKTIDLVEKVTNRVTYLLIILAASNIGGPQIWALIAKLLI